MSLIKDFVITGYNEKEIQEARSYLTEFVHPYDVTKWVEYFCKGCGIQIAQEMFDPKNDTKIQVILAPSTRVVIGIQPSERTRLEKMYRMNITLGWEESSFYCENCSQKLWLGLSLLIESMNNFYGNGGRSEYEWGCWLTSTKIRPYGYNQAYSFQFMFKRFLEILFLMQLETWERLKPYLPIISGKT